MDFQIRLGFIFIGIVIFVWGFLIVASPQFFKYWQDSYWKEKNNEHLKPDHQFNNKWLRGFSALFAGASMIYLFITN
jgi:hypothetical protein